MIRYSRAFRIYLIRKYIYSLMTSQISHLELTGIRIWGLKQYILRGSKGVIEEITAYWKRCGSINRFLEWEEYPEISKGVISGLFNEASMWWSKMTLIRTSQVCQKWLLRTTPMMWKARKWLYYLWQLGAPAGNGQEIAPSFSFSRESENAH